MRFSIRSLLALTLLVALAALAWKNLVELRRMEAQIEVVRASSQAAQDRIEVQFYSPGYQQRKLEQDDIAAMALKASRQFRQLEEKYGTLESVDENTFSFRTLPSLQISEGQDVKLRLFIPAHRPVWLKCVVTANETARRAPGDDQLLRTSPFTKTGPFEWRLPLGMHDLTISYRHAVDGKMPFKLQLDHDVLLETEYVDPDVRHASLSWPNAQQASHTPPDKKLPGLMRAAISLSLNRRAEHFVVWLADSSSEFAPAKEPQR